MKNHYICGMEGFVYLWTNNRNGRKYIGSHKGNIDDGYIGSGVYFNRAYKKEPHNFIREILYIGLDYRIIEEQYLLKYDVMNNENYYNLKNTAIGGWGHVDNEETIIKRGKSISKSKKGRPRKTGKNDLRYGEKNGMYGKNHTEDTIALLRQRAKERDSKYLWKAVVLLPDNILYDNLHIAAEKLDLSQPTISHHLAKNETIKRGKLKGKKLVYAKNI